MRTAGIARPLPSSPRTVSGKFNLLAPNRARTRKAAGGGIHRTQPGFSGSPGSRGTPVLPQAPKGSSPRGRPPLVIQVRLSWLGRGTARDQTLIEQELPAAGQSKLPPPHGTRRTTTPPFRAPLPALATMNADCLPSQIGCMSWSGEIPNRKARGLNGPRAHDRPGRPSPTGDLK